MLFRWCDIYGVYGVCTAGLSWSSSARASNAMGSCSSVWVNIDATYGVSPVMRRCLVRRSICLML